MLSNTRLTLEITTDGSVKPEDALAYAGKILKEQVQVFINFDEELAEPEIEEEPEDQQAPLFARLRILPRFPPGDPQLAAPHPAGSADHPL